MSYLYSPISVPTRLYIKKCSHCELKYFGKTTLQDIDSYSGSGDYWLKHLRKHNATVIHLWNSAWYHDDSIVRFATKFSKLNNIVESRNWANLKIEDGLDGGDPGPAGRAKIRETLKSLHATEKGKELLRKIGRSVSKTMNDPIWKETIGKDRSVSQKQTKQSQAYRDKNYKQCEHCDWYGDPANYNKLHGDNCVKVNPTLHEQLKLSTVFNFSTKKVCVHCGTTTNSGNYKRWHGDNCRIHNPELHLAQIKKLKIGKEKVRCEHCGSVVDTGNYSLYHGNNCRHKQILTPDLPR